MGVGVEQACVRFSFKWKMFAKVVIFLAVSASEIFKILCLAFKLSTVNSDAMLFNLLAINTKSALKGKRAKVSAFLQRSGDHNLHSITVTAKDYKGAITLARGCKLCRAIDQETRLLLDGLKFESQLQLWTWRPDKVHYQSHFSQAKTSFHSVTHHLRTKVGIISCKELRCCKDQIVQMGLQLMGGTFILLIFLSTLQHCFVTERKY